MFRRKMKQDIDEFLTANEQDYYEFDYFIEVQAITKQMKKEEWGLIFENWETKTFEWKTRFIECLHDVDKAYIEQLTIKVLSDKDNDEFVLNLMVLLPSHAQNNQLYTDLLMFSKKYWDEKPEERSRLKIRTWSCGLSKRLLKEIGFETWTQAGLKET